MPKTLPRTNLLSINIEKPVFWTVVIYLILVILFEIIGYTFGVIYGSLGNALLLLVAINYSAWENKTALHSILPPAALIPLMRLLAVVLPVPGWLPQIAYVVVSVPLLFTVGIIIYNSQISLADLGLQWSSWKFQLPIALSGIPLGMIGYMILRPEQLFELIGSVSWATSLLIILVFIAFTEEIIFRGLFLHAVTQVSDNFALISSAILYGIYHIGSGSLGYAFFMGVVGWLFGYFALRTRSLWGIIIAHFLLTVGIGLFWHVLL